MPSFLHLLVSTTLLVAGTAPFQDASCTADDPDRADRDTDAYCIQKDVDKCNIDRIAKKDISSDRFRQEFFLQKPVIITNAKPMPSSSGKGWSTAELVKQYGEVLVGIGSSRTMVRVVGSEGQQMAPLRDVAETIKANAKASTDAGTRGSSEKRVRMPPDIYAFEKDSNLFRNAPELVASINETATSVFGPWYNNHKQLQRTSEDGNNPNIPNNTNDEHVAMVSKYTDEYASAKNKWSYYFALGSEGSGVHLHHHTDGWSYLFEGRKRWFFRPPDTMPSITHMGFMSMHYWYTKGVYPKLKENELPLECVQEEGDLIYIPEGWWHGTLNEGSKPVLSVAVQRAYHTGDLAFRLAKAMDEKGAGNWAETANILERLLSDYPDTTEAWYVLGFVHGMQRNHPDVAESKLHLRKELAAKKMANSLTGGRSCDALNNLGTALIHNRKFEEAEVVLKKAIALCEWDDYSHKNMAVVLLELSREAEKKAKKIDEEWVRPQVTSIGNATYML